MKIGNLANCTSISIYEPKLFLTWYKYCGIA
nr:MAG TPA: hypothetical protein [Caudoviricetes sp.]